MGGGVRKKDSYKIHSYCWKEGSMADTMWGFWWTLFLIHTKIVYVILTHILHMWTLVSESRQFALSHTAGMWLSLGVVLHLSNAKPSSCHNVTSTSQWTHIPARPPLRAPVPQRATERKTGLCPPGSSHLGGMVKRWCSRHEKQHETHRRESTRLRRLRRLSYSRLCSFLVTWLGVNNLYYFLILTEYLI